MARDLLSPTPPGIIQQVDAPPGLFRQPPSPTLVSPDKLIPNIYQRIKYANPHFQLLAGDNSLSMGRSIGESLQKIVPDNQPEFKNGEIKVNVPPPNYQARDVYIVQSTLPHPHKSFTQLLLLADAAKHAGANSITAIVPHLAYSRQDRIDVPGAPQSGKLMAEIILDTGSHHKRRLTQRHTSQLTSDAKLLVVDVHNTAPLEEMTTDTGFQWVNLDAGKVLLPKVKQLITENNLDIAVAFPDHGAEGRYEGYANELCGGIQHAAVIDKVRDPHKNNVVSISEKQESLSDKVAGKDVLLFDDIIDTGGSIKQAAEKLKADGAKSVRIIATHGIFSGSALENLHIPAIDGVIITNTIQQLPEVTEDPLFTIVDISPLIAETIRRIEYREPLGDLVKSQSKNFEKAYTTWRANKERRKVAKKERQLRRSKRTEQTLSA